MGACFAVSRPSARISWRSLILLIAALTLTGLVSAKNAEPRISKTSFENRLYGLFYFGDSNVVVAFDSKERQLHRSVDAGEHWTTVEEIPKGRVVDLIQHPYDDKKAYVLSAGHKHWRTDNQGESWHEFETATTPSSWRPALVFHAGDSNKMIFQGDACRNLFECDEVGLYTTDGFESKPKLLRTGIRGCSFARATKEFTTRHDPTDDNRVLCIVKGRYSPWPRDYRLVISDNYFQDAMEAEPDLEPGRTVQGLVNMATVKKFMVVAAKASGTDEMALYVTHDTATWHRAMFQGEHKVEEDAYTILESTDYSIQVDVLSTRPRVAMGNLFTSNSNGTFFRRNIDHTHRGIRGYADFETIQNIQGIILVNVVANWEEVEKSPRTTKRKVRSQISFDDGQTFKSLRAGDEDLHLHSVTDVREPGRIFSSPAPGIVMGVGNTGDELKPYDDCDLYISDDAGRTWRKTRDGPHKYEFGNQGAVLVAVADKKLTNQLAYSINHGQSWEYVELDEKIHVRQLTTTPDSTSLKFVLLGSLQGEMDQPHRVFAIDFNGMHERKCDEDDFERWCARLNDKGECDCLMGHQQFYRRRKADADCFVDEASKDPQPELVKCVCTDEDFECDYNFVPSGDQCLQTRRFKAPEGECKDPKGTFKGSSGWRLFPGNDCIREGGSKKDEPKEWPCEDLIEPPVNKDISREITNFKKDVEFREKYYLPRAQTSTGTDETIIMRTDRKLYITHDHGKNWEPILERKHVEAIYKHDFFNDVVFFITNGRAVYYTTDRGQHFHEFNAPSKPNTLGIQILNFHPDHKDWLIWVGAQDCERSKNDEECHAVASISTDRGDTWKTLLRYVRRCQFLPVENKNGRGPLAHDSARDRRAGAKRIICSQHRDEDNKKPLQLVASKDFFDDKTVHLPDIIDFTTMSEFLVVAAKAEERDSLKVVASIDGETFADAHFPPDFDVHHESAYTVLNSSTHAVFLHVTVNEREGYEYGSILKSNSNGTSYVLSIEGVNRNSDGYADFEKMKGLEGVALVNVVDNLEATKSGSERKKIKTKITHNDGAEWMLLAPPKTDVDGKDTGCSEDDFARESCSLHLHGYTERVNPGNTYSSASAVGLMLATGNVGEYLSSSKGEEADTNTFITNDGGITWKMIKKGRYLWEYGDQGAIIVIVAQSTPTNEVFYSINEGQTWESYVFTKDGDKKKKKMVVSDISTVPSDLSQNFVLWGQFEEDNEDGQEITTINLDFSNLRDRQCVLDEKDPEGGDYYLWTPSHPAQDGDCLFGHVSQYHRKRTDRDCFNGRPIEGLHSIARNCSCSRRDFECDYNYARQKDGSCGLVPGLSPLDHSKICQKEPSRIEYYEPTGYRRIPLTTCQGGRELDKLVAHSCPKHQKEFESKHRLGGWGLFFAVVIPIIVAVGVGWWVYTRWDGKFGQIKLGADGTLGGTGMANGGGGVGSGGGSKMIWDAERPWIKYPVMVLAVSVAVVIAVPDTMRRGWRAVSGRFGGGVGSGTRGGGWMGTARSGRTRGAYTGLGGDEDEGGETGGRRYTTRDSFARRNTTTRPYGDGAGDATVDDEGELLGSDDDDGDEGGDDGVV